jgi:hypothetical protein
MMMLSKGTDTFWENLLDPARVATGKVKGEGNLKI